MGPTLLLKLSFHQDGSGISRDSSRFGNNSSRILYIKEETTQRGSYRKEEKERTINQRKKLLHLFQVLLGEVPKFKSKKTEKKLAPDGETEHYWTRIKLKERCSHY
ncbi:CFC_HP_G0102310.mRNA.1.CDS.1 [Saccharomyces cerevisiae]|nr:CFC_HP_G0102310.mRNA.1.CDS.1 [Saccharomyces cerevisiae]CAI6904031.1 CFC_HP_G0102310.mRNA.1.CDS.1 [Saccharomyces cerevisiae]